jgi:hypothetical protein
MPPDPPRRPPRARSMTPAYGGVQVPPPASQPPSEQYFSAVKAAIDGLGVTLGERLDQVDARLDQHEDEMRELRESATVQREIRAEMREQGAVLSRLSRDVGQVIRSDASQTVDLAKLEAKVIASVEAKTTQMADAAGTEAGAEAGKQAGRRQSRVALALSALAVVAALAKACEEAIRAAPFDPQTEPRP